MNRRDFVGIAAASAVALGLKRQGSAKTVAAPQFAITMDDFNWRNAVHLTAEERNRAILDTLRANRVKAALFVIGRNADDDDGKTLLRSWDDAGHIIGNHTYSHRSLNSEITVAEYEEDIQHAENILRDFKQFQKIFRFPALKEGNTAAKRDGVRAFLKSHGYRIGHVTIDNSDWIVDQRLSARLQKDPKADVNPYRDFYLEHMWDRADYYDSLAKKVTGRPVKHTVLMHFNLLNGLFLGDLIEMFKGKGWQLIDAEEAFTDPIFRAEPKVLPAGESIVWSLAKEKGTIAKSLRYPAEDGDYETARMNKLGL
ncbi:MAG TPA: polysaccharide deacetylase family protein [Pyrinomonadaceae bacterium]|nr:polysaccharide deacetylase family protein [Pyrinomonadaceae bacterium]